MCIYIYIIQVLYKLTLMLHKIQQLLSNLFQLLLYFTFWDQMSHLLGYNCISGRRWILLVQHNASLSRENASHRESRNMWL